MFEFSQHLSQKRFAEGKVEGKHEVFDLITMIRKKMRDGMSLDEALASSNVPENERDWYRSVLS